MKKHAEKFIGKLREPKSLRLYTWTSFMLFVTIILLLLWLFQYVFLESYYETMKSRDLGRVADKIENNIDSPNLAKQVRNLAFKNSFAIAVTDSGCNLVQYENTMGSFSLIDADIRRNFNRGLYDMKSRLIDSGKSWITITPKLDGNDDIRKMIYVTSAQSDTNHTFYIFIEASVEPIDATANIIKEQLIYITVIIFELAFIITLFLSKRFSRPIDSLTATAEKFAKGDLNVKFEPSKIREVNQLSDVLNTASDEIQRVETLRRDIVANVSHDLRTPLTIIKSYAEMIRDLSGDNPEKRNEHLDVIINESDRLSNLVNSILELSKLESAKKELELNEFSLHEKLSEVMSRYTLLNEQDGYNIHTELSEDVTCLADFALIEQVLYNLINNAVNYCGADKEVIIRQLNKEGFVRIEVCDHGEGIDEKLLPHIFDRYYRAPKSKRDVIGTGLGLSIVKQILKQHGFAFGVSSTVGEGSVFWFEIKVI